MLCYVMYSLLYSLREIPQALTDDIIHRLFIKVIRARPLSIMTEFADDILRFFCHVTRVNQ